MIESAFRGASLLSLGALLVVPPGTDNLALWGIVVTSACSLIKSIIDKRAERQLREDQHRFELEDRAAAAKARDTLMKGLEENTALTREASAAAAAAYDTANHVNAKIAGIAEAALAQAKAEAK